MAWMLNVTVFPGTASFSSGGWEVILRGSAACKNQKRNVIFAHKALNSSLQLK